MEDNNLKDSLQNDIQTILEADGIDNSGIEMLGQLMNMSDEEFSVVGPIFLDNLANQLNTVNDKIVFVQSLRANGVTYNDLIETIHTLEQTDDWVEASNMSREKADFLLKLLMIFANAFDEAEGGMVKLNIPVKLLNADAKLPTYSTIDAAGMDVYATDDYTILPGETRIIPTGIAMEIPKGYAIFVQPRSGLSAKTKLRIANTPGLIDSDYRGEIGVIIENIEPKIKDLIIDEDGKATGVLYGSEANINKGDRIAQLVLIATPKAILHETSTIGDTARGDGGYGSTGK